jgi:hypothetical protein
VGAAFVADPIGVGIPERAGVEHHDAPAGARQPLGQRGAAGAGTHDDNVYLIALGVAAHVGAQLVVDP